MSDLKTLKDIATRRPKGIELPVLDYYRERLREEAIKWYKNEANKEYHTEPDTAMDFIKNFFNLLEEDLT